MLLIVQKRLNTEIRKEQIAEAAVELILKFGSENLTIRLLADEVGISAGAIYRHFDSKNAIFSFLLNRISERLFGEVKKGLIVNARIIDHLHYIFMNNLSNIHRERAVSFQIMAEVISLGDKKLYNQFEEIINDYLTYLKNLLTLGIRTGEIREDIDLDSVAMLFYSMMGSISNYWALNNYQFDLEEKMKSMWEVFRKAVINTGMGNLGSSFKNYDMDSKNKVYF